MGNCLKRKSLPEYATDDDDDWDLPEKYEGLPSKNDDLSGKTTEIKIKITKKQLEELLGKVDVKGLRAEQVLTHLVSHSDRFLAHQRAWRPNLQSIPEVD